MTTRFSTADIRALAAEELKYGDSNVVGRMLIQLLDDRDRLVAAVKYIQGITTHINARAETFFITSQVLEEIKENGTVAMKFLPPEERLKEVGE